MLNILLQNHTIVAYCNIYLKLIKIVIKSKIAEVFIFS